MSVTDVLSYAAVVGFALLVGAYARYDSQRRARRAHERRALLVDYAQHREWTFTDSDLSLASRFQCSPFDQGNERHVRNVFSGRYGGRPFVAFDFEAVVRRRKSTDRHPYSVVAVDLGVASPGLVVSPVGFAGRVVDALLGRDISVGHAVFDHAFTVESPAPEFAADVLRPPVIDVALQHADLAWRFEGSSLLVVGKGEHSPDDVEEKLEFMDELLDHLSPEVRSRLMGEPPH